MTGPGTEAEGLQSLSEDTAKGRKGQKNGKTKLIRQNAVTSQQYAACNSIYPQLGVSGTELGTYLR